MMQDKETGRAAAGAGELGRVRKMLIECAADADPGTPIIPVAEWVAMHGVPTTFEEYQRFERFANLPADDSGPGTGVTSPASSSSGTKPRAIRQVERRPVE